jgi:hypothetical protein
MNKKVTNILIERLDRVANSLEAKGLIKDAEALDIVANTLSYTSKSFEDYIKEYADYIEKKDKHRLIPAPNDIGVEKAFIGIIDGTIKTSLHDIHEFFDKNCYFLGGMIARAFVEDGKDPKSFDDKDYVEYSGIIEDFLKSEGTLGMPIIHQISAFMKYAKNKGIKNNAHHTWKSMQLI